MNKNETKHILVKHPEFDFLQVKPSPTVEEITKFYVDEFYSGEYKRFNDSSLEVQLENRNFYEGGWSDTAQNIETLTGRSLSGMSLLDIGCGWAQALLHFSGKGMNCYGFDPAPEAIDYGISKGLNLRLAGMEKMNVFEGMRFDVVMLNNVLEHLADPVAAIKEIHQNVLKIGGLLIIDVPNEFNTFQVAGRDVHGLSDWWVVPPCSS